MCDNISSRVSPVTLMVHFMVTAVSSDTTRSTHLRLGSLSLRICFLTIASKARSGVKSPVLEGHGISLHFVVGVQKQTDTNKGKRNLENRKEEGGGNKKRKRVCCVSHF